MDPFGDWADDLIDEIDPIQIPQLEPPTPTHKRNSPTCNHVRFPDPNERFRKAHSSSLPSSITLQSFPSAFPLEIVAEILTHACRAVEDDSGWHYIVSPLRLGQICSLWRSFMWSTPSFWTTLIITKDITRPNFILEWLDRTRGRPIDIYFQGCHSPQQLLVLNGLTKIRQRWRNVDLEYGPVYFPSQWFGRRVKRAAWPGANMADGVGLTHLQSITIGAMDHRFRKQVFHLTKAPALRTLRLSHFDGDFMTKVLHDTTHITNLTLSNILEDISPRSLFRSYTNLTHATFIDVTALAGLRAMRDPVDHFPLQSLKIKVKRWTDMERLVESLNAPNLKELSVLIDDSPPNFTLLRIRAFVQRSECNLTYLSFRSCYQEQALFIEVLESLPTLVELHVQLPKDATFAVPQPTNGFFHALHPTIRPSYLPHLETLTYQGAVAEDSFQFLEPLILRTGIIAINEQNAFSPTLRSLKIQADQGIVLVESINCELYLQVFSLLRVGVFLLINYDGTPWVVA